MLFTDISRLKRLLATYTDRSKSDHRRTLVGTLLQKRFPPMRCTGLYARLLREADLSDQARWMTMLILYYVGDETAVRGIRAFLYEPSMPSALKFTAAMLLFSLNPRLKLEPSKHLPKFPLLWLQHAATKFPNIPERERRKFVMEELLFNFFEESEG